MPSVITSWKFKAFSDKKSGIRRMGANPRSLYNQDVIWSVAAVELAEKQRSQQPYRSWKVFHSLSLEHAAEFSPSAACSFLLSDFVSQIKVFPVIK